MKRSLITLICALMVIFTVKAQVIAPTIQVCGGNQVFCLEQDTFELNTKITVIPGLPADIDHFEITWGDNSSLTIIPGSNNPANQAHTYDLDNFYLTCTYEEKYLVTLETFLTNGRVLNSSFQVTFQNPPQAIFTIDPMVICVGEEICFKDASCPSENYEVVSWEYGDGSAAGSDACHTYNQVGNYLITLNVENNCGTASATQELQVISPPEAAATISSNNVDDVMMPYIYCLGSGLVAMNGDSLSLNESTYTWSSLNAYPGASWVLPPPNSNDPTPNIPNPAISFTDTGFYEIILTVNNDCDHPSRDTVTIQVLSGEALTQPNQVDACLSLDYTPENYNPNATYTINGNVVSSFPIALGVDQYEVICTLENECGSQTTIDQFEVFDKEDVSITSPFPDTIVCIGSDSFLIVYTPTGGNWVGQHLSFYGDSTFFHPIATGMFEIHYQKGLGNCQDEISIIITVEDPGINTTSHTVCSTSPPFPIGATPIGGTYTSIDCPACIQNDTFIINQMLAIGLTTVEVSYNVISTGGCEGDNSFTVSIEDPFADFIVDSIFCEDDPIVVDFSNSIGTLSWEIDGQSAGTPPFNNLSPGPHNINLIAQAGDCDTQTSQDIYISSSPTNVNFEVQPIEGCADLEVTLSNTTASFDNEAYEWYIGDSLFSTAIQSGTIILPSGLSDTIYTIHLIAANSCKGEEFSQDILVFPKPRAKFGPMKDSYCSGEAVEFANVSTGGPMNSWFWDYGNGMTSTDSIPLEIVYFADTIPQDYTISLTAANNCDTLTYSYTLTIQPTDVRAFFNLSQDSICVGEEICLTNLSTPGTAILWDFGDDNTNIDSRICHHYSTPGTYTITLKAFGCGFDSILTTIIVLPLPLFEIGNLDIECPGDSMQFFLENSMNVEGYNWRFGDGDSSLLAAPFHIYLQSGLYQVNFVGTSVAGCSQRDSIQVNIPNAPVASFTPSNDSICQGEIISFTNTSSNDVITCLWDFGNDNFSNECNPSISFDQPGKHTIRLIASNASGCQDTTYKVINVDTIPKPKFDIIINRQCTPAEIVFTNHSEHAQSYFWDFGNGMTSTELNPTIIYNQSDTFSVQLRAFNQVCSEEITKELIIYPTPEPLLTLSENEGCAPLEINLGVAVNQVNLDYQWTISNGTTFFDSLSMYQFDSSGRYGIKLLISSEFCRDSIIDSVTIFEPVLIESEVINNLCFGGSAGQILTNIQNGSAPFQYQWSNNATTEDQEDLVNGTYALIITDSNNCQLIDSFIISSPPPIQAVVADSAIATCAGDSSAYLCLSLTGGIDPYEVTWSDDSNGDCIEVIPAGEYLAQISDSNNCLVEFIFQAYENPPINFIDQLSQISCFGFNDGRIRIDSISGGASNFYNSILIGLDTLKEGRNFSNLTPGSYTLVIQDLEGCTIEKEYQIGEPDSIWLDIQEDTIRLPLGESIHIDTRHNASNPTFKWSPTDSLSCIDCEFPLASPIKTTWYSVLMDEEGCFAQDSVLILIDQNRQYYVPNIFTPNEDGRNDLFRIRSRVKSIRRIITFQIFDRWGEKIFQADNFKPQEENPNHAWDGMFRGKLLFPDVFTYWFIIEYEDYFQEKVKGTITLMR